MDVLQNGLQWLQDYTESVMVQNVKLSYPGRSEWDATARVTSCDGIILQEGQKIQVQYFVFVISTKHFPEPPQRGMLITWNGNVYEIAIQGKLLWEFDDPHQLNYAIRTVFKHAC
jgi:hypothetical protein